MFRHIPDTPRNILDNFLMVAKGFGHYFSFKEPDSKTSSTGGGEVFFRLPLEFGRYGHDILQRPSPRYLTTFKTW